MTTTRPQTIGILTGGGDVPGLNPGIKQLVMRAAQLGITVKGIRRGWEGLLAYTTGPAVGDPPLVQTLAPSGVRTIDRSGGTVLHTSRTNPAAVRHKDAPAHLKAFFADPAQKHDFTAQVLANLSQLAIEAAAAGKTGMMVALQKGCGTTVDIDVVTGGAKRVDVAAFYDEEHYRPHIRSLGGKPMFLY